MKIELTEDEVKKIGFDRYQPPRYIIISFIGLLLFIVIAVIGGHFRALGWRLLLLEVLPLIMIAIPYLMMVKDQVKFARHFLSEQQHLQEMEAWQKPGVKSNPNFKEV